MIALRDTRGLRWQAALASTRARQRAVPADRVQLWHSAAANGRAAFEATQAARLVREAVRHDRRNTPEARANRWALEAFCEAYLYLPFRCKQLPAPPQQETRPVPEEVPAILTVDFAARALVQHPDALHEELAAAAQVSVNPAWLEDWRLANSATPTDPRLRRFHYDPDPNRERYNYRAPEMTIQRPATLAEAIRQVYDVDIEHLVDQALTTGDYSLVPDRYRLVRIDRSVYLLHDDLLGLEDGRLLVGYSLNGEAPQRVATWHDLRHYIERVKAAQAKRDALRQAA